MADWSETTLEVHGRDSEVGKRFILSRFLGSVREYGVLREEAFFHTAGSVCRAVLHADETLEETMYNGVEKMGFFTEGLAVHKVIGQ